MSDEPPKKKRWKVTSRWRGAGDLAADIIRPIARVSDRVFGTKLQGCQGCHGKGGRQERWNEVIPFHSKSDDGDAT